MRQEEVHQTFHVQHSLRIDHHASIPIEIDATMPTRWYVAEWYRLNGQGLIVAGDVYLKAVLLVSM